MSAEPERTPPTFEKFASQAAPDLIRFATFLSGDVDVAHDVTAEVLGRMWVRWARIVDRPGADPGSYARTSVRNALRSRWRSGLRRLRAIERVSHRPGHGPAGWDDDVADRELLHEAMRCLSERDRAILALRFFEDRPVDSVAEILGVPPGTVKSATSRALDQLRSNLKSDKELTYESR